MKLNIVDLNKFIEINHIQEVRNPVYFDKGRQPTSDGLFSFEIFGRPGSYDRKTAFGYIDLKQKFLHPLAYKTLLRINRKFEDCIHGRKYFLLDPAGEIMEASDDTKGSGTGLEFLYKNWDNMKFRISDSISRKERLDLLKALKKNEAFMDKELVIPAFYRDVNFKDVDNGKVAHDAVNDLYAKLIRMTASMRETDEVISGLDFVGNMTRSNIQLCLIDIYNYFKVKVERKNGLFRQAVMGKSVDYAGRSVISAPSFNVDTYKDMKVSFEYSGVPLSQVINVFFPYIVKWLQDKFQSEFGNLKTLPVLNKKTGEFDQVQLVNALDDFTYDEIKKRIDMFTKAPTERFDIVTVNTERGRLNLKFFGREKDPNKAKMDSTIGQRFLTWTDLFYMAAVDVVKDKHVYVTRYPLEDYFGIYPSKINVLSTFKTSPQILGGTVYENYPVIDLDTPSEKIPGLFIDALQLFNAFLPALGGFENCHLTLLIAGKPF